MSDKKKTYDIFGGNRFIESMRSSGYRDTSYAVGEIVDNAIDAGAKHVEILCQDKINHSTNRRSVEQIAILDDGQGMNVIELRNSLLFGDGTRGSSSKDIGKYGMGLPNSSLSQCKRVDVYSWQNSSTPNHCYIDVDAVKKGEREIPEPKATEIPKTWKKAAKHFSKKSGTLVVWSKLDRCTWTTSGAVINNSKFLIGRIYRKFLGNKSLTMHIMRFIVNDNDEIIEPESEIMLPNDPMYLIAPSSTPDKWGKKAMFKPDTIAEESHKIRHDGQEHEIVVRYSIEKDELRSPETVQVDQGGTKLGRHARKNQGISIIRADREIILDDFGLPHDARDRWWGVEIDIPPSLDLVVGLTNNKQQVDNLSSILRTQIQLGSEEDAENPERPQDDYEDELKDKDTSVADLFVMAKKIQSHIRSMQNRIRAQRSGTRKGSKKTPLDIKLETGLKKDKEDGSPNQSDIDREKIPKEQRKEEIKDALIDEGIEAKAAEQTADLWVNEDRKIIIESASLDNSNFFSIQNTGGVLRIKINIHHKAYKNLILLTDTTEYEHLSDSERLALTKDGLRLLLVSWARFEDQIDNDKRRMIVQNIRTDWSRKLNTFLEPNEN